MRPCLQELIVGYGQQADGPCLIENTQPRLRGRDFDTPERHWKWGIITHKFKEVVELIVLQSCPLTTYDREESRLRIPEKLQTNSLHTLVRQPYDLQGSRGGLINYHTLKPAQL